MAKINSIAPFPADINRDAFGHWLSGFTDGEGSFFLSYVRPVKWRPTPRALFQIILRVDDKPILETIRTYLGCGRIYTHRRASSGAETAHFVVYRPRDLLAAVIPHFDRYSLRAKKAADYVIWREAAVICCAVNHRRQVGGHGRGPLAKWSAQELIAFSEIRRRLLAHRDSFRRKNLPS